MKNTTKTKGETRRRSSRGSISDDPVPTKTAKVDDLKQISEGLKTELKKVIDLYLSLFNAILFKRTWGLTL